MRPRTAGREALEGTPTVWGYGGGAAEAMEDVAAKRNGEI